MFKKTFIILIIVAFSLNAFANTPKSTGKYKNWESFTAETEKGKICFAQTVPTKRAPSAIQRGKSKLFVTFRPKENIKDEVSITAGYDFNKKNSITATSGKFKYTFDEAKQGFAWIMDVKQEKKMIKTMKRGSRIMITGYNQKGSQTIDHYSLLGFTKAYNTVKKACS